jgi:hypothetical protein
MLEGLKLKEARVAFKGISLPADKRKTQQRKTSVAQNKLNQQQIYDYFLSQAGMNRGNYSQLNY